MCHQEVWGGLSIGPIALKSGQIDKNKHIANQEKSGPIMQRDVSLSDSWFKFFQCHNCLCLDVNFEKYIPFVS